MHKHREVQEVKWRINEMNLFYFESVQLTCWLRHGTRSPPPTPPTVRNLTLLLLVLIRGLWVLTVTV